MTPLSLLLVRDEVKASMHSLLSIHIACEWGM